jgi:hypothetical protein
MNECIDSTMGRIPRMLAVLLARDDPRTSWSFQEGEDGVGEERRMEGRKGLKYHWKSYEFFFLLTLKG